MQVLVACQQAVSEWAASRSQADSQPDNRGADSVQAEFLRDKFFEVIRWTEEHALQLHKHLTDNIFFRMIKDSKPKYYDANLALLFGAAKDNTDSKKPKPKPNAEAADAEPVLKGHGNRLKIFLTKTTAQQRTRHLPGPH